MALPQGHEFPGDGADGDGVDRISGLPEELLLQVLVRLGCAREAARTAVLARRWHELPTRLPEYTFRGVEPEAVEVALARVTRPALDRLHIEAELTSKAAIGRATSLLRAAAERKPEKFTASLRRIGGVEGDEEAIDLPCFDCARSLVLDGKPGVSFTWPPAGEFTRLESLDLTLSRAIPDALLQSCPRLRVLRINGALNEVTVRSTTLEELKVTIRSTMLEELEVTAGQVRRVEVEAPLLKEAKLDIDVARKLSVSFSAPAVESLVWEFTFDFGSARLPELRCVEYKLKLGIRTLLLRLSIEGSSFSLVPKRCFAQEIARLQVADFSVLSLVVESGGHAFGPLLLHLLKIRPVIRKLQLELNQDEMVDGVELCPQNCSCRQPTNWKNENISLPDLEEVTICYGFEIEDEEVDFFKLLLRSAPMLKSLEVGVPGKGIKKIRKICKKYPHVECDVSHNYMYLM